MGVVRVELSGHLTEQGLRQRLVGAGAELESLPEPRVLLVNCAAMTGYDAEARRLFMDWNAARKRRIAAVAVVTDKPLWHVVVSAMALASSQVMRAFDTEVDAEAWARAQTS